MCMDDNPANYSSKLVPAACLEQTTWFTGPAILHKPSMQQKPPHSVDSVNLGVDVDICPQGRSLHRTFSKVLQLWCSCTRHIITDSHHNISQVWRPQIKDIRKLSSDLCQRSICLSLRADVQKAHSVPHTALTEARRGVCRLLGIILDLKRPLFWRLFGMLSFPVRYREMVKVFHLM